MDIEVMTLDHRERAVAEDVVSVQRAAYAVEAALIGYDRMPGLLEGLDDVMGLPLGYGSKGTCAASLGIPPGAAAYRIHLGDGRARVPHTVDGFQR